MALSVRWLVNDHLQRWHESDLSIRQDCVKVVVGRHSVTKEFGIELLSRF